MSEKGEQKSSGNVRSLADALRKVRLAEAERGDVVVELRDAERARLDMLADELRGVFAEVPAEDEQFIYKVVPGNQPRLWIDMTGFIVLGRDRRTYRFLKDTRLGRTVVLETADLDDMADCVTNYVAERILERERAIEGDWVLERMARRPGEAAAAVVPVARERLRKARQAVRDVLVRDKANAGWTLSAFLFGILIGVAGLLAYAWMKIPG